MPVLKYLADTNIVSDYFRPGNPVKDWFAKHRGEIGISHSPWLKCAGALN